MRARWKQGCRWLSLFLCCVLLFPLGMTAATAFSSETGKNSIPDFRERYETDRLTPSEAILYASNGGHLIFSVQSSGASFSFVPLPYQESTECNAFRFVLENRTSCEKLTVSYTYGTDSRIHTQELAIVPSSGKTSYLFYVDQAQEISEITVTFEGVRSGLVHLYSINRVSAYQTLTEEYGRVTECRCDLANTTISVTGRLLSGVSVRYPGAQLRLYRLPVGMDLFDLLQDENRVPLETVRASTRFSFTVLASEQAERLSQYAVTIVTREGTEFPLTYEFSVNSFGTEHSAPSVDYGFFGILSDQTATAISMGCGTAILDVDLAELLNGGSAGYTYSLGNVSLSINRSVVTALDSKIRSYSAAGVRVLLRLLIAPDCVSLPFVTAEPVEAEYKGVLLETDEARNAWFAAMVYLVSRYGKGGNGSADGIILGSSVDDAADRNDCGVISLKRYLASYAQAMKLIHTAILREKATLQLVLPLSDTVSSDVIDKTQREGVYNKQLFLSGVLQALSHLGCDTPKILLESNHAPVILSESESGEEILPAEGASTEVYTVANLSSFETLLTQCGADDGYFFLFRPDASWTDAQLLIYSLYTYQALSGNSRIQSLILNPSSEQWKAIGPAFSALCSGRTVGTQSFVLEALGVSSWGELFPDADKRTDRSFLEGQAGISSASAMGTYACWDFTSSVGTLGWYGDRNVSSLSMGATESYGRTLTALLTFSSDDTAGVYNCFSQPEDMSVYDALAFRFAIGDSGKQTASYEVRITLFGEDFRLDHTTMVRGGELSECSVSVADLPGTVQTVRFSVRSLNQKETSATLYLKSGLAYSTTYGDTELKNLILEKREEIRSELNGTASSPESSRWRPMALVSVLALTLVLCFVVIRLRKQKRKEDQ